jgi:putative ABC transport system permease protein
VIAPLVIDAAVIGPLRHSPGRSVLAVIAIALGIALGFAIYLINRSAADEVSLAARSLFGLADLAVESVPEGFDEALYPQIARIPGVAAASPVVEVEAKIVGHRRALTLIGLDAFRSRQLQPAFASLAGSMLSSGISSLDAHVVFLNASAARDLNLKTGDVLDVQIGMQRQQLQVAAVLPAAALEDRAGVIDIATAQWKFGRLGKLSRINLRLAPGANPTRVREALTALLPSTVRVTTPGQATDDALRLSRAYRSNLTALALVALFTGGFFVYSTQALAALRRRREFAILHAIGVTRAQQLVLTLFGSAIVGICGALVGILAGIAIATLGLSALGADLGAGYFTGAASGLNVHAAEIVAFSMLGIVVAVAGALRPALDAARVPTASALKAGDVASAQMRTHGRLVLGLALLAAAVLAVPPIAGLPLPGYVSIALLLIGTVVAMPSVVRFALGHAPRIRALPYQIAIAQIAGTARYATLSVSAIIVSFSLMVSMAIMVTSFRTSLDHWAQQVLPADLYVRVGYVGQSAHLDQDAVAAMSRLPGVRRLESTRYAAMQMTPQRPPATLIARTLDPDDAQRSMWIMHASSASAPAASVPVWINEAAADLFELRAGDTVKLPIGGQTINAFVRGIWRDYEHQNGAFVVSRDTYVRLSGDRAVNTVWLWLDDGVSEERMRGAIRDVLPAGAEFDLRSPRELRKLSLAAFDRTFAITYLLELVAVLIGLFGIAAGISAQVLARRGELGALRHLGFTRGQIGTMLAIEGAVLGALGVIVGLLAGAVVSLILIHVVNRQSFHWSMDLSVPVGLVVGLSVALIAASALIATISGREAMSVDVVRAVKEDW